MSRPTTHYRFGSRCRRVNQLLRTANECNRVDMVKTAAPCMKAPSLGSSETIRVAGIGWWAEVLHVGKTSSATRHFVLESVSSVTITAPPTWYFCNGERI
jgi:hypothetical protein